MARAGAFQCGRCLKECRAGGGDVIEEDKVAPSGKFRFRHGKGVGDIRAAHLPIRNLALLFRVDGAREYAVRNGKRELWGEYLRDKARLVVAALPLPAGGERKRNDGERFERDRDILEVTAEEFRERCRRRMGVAEFEPVHERTHAFVVIKACGAEEVREVVVANLRGSRNARKAFAAAKRLRNCDTGFARGAERLRRTVKWRAAGKATRREEEVEKAREHLFILLCMYALRMFRAGTRFVRSSGSRPLSLAPTAPAETKPVVAPRTPARNMRATRRKDG